MSLTFATLDGSVWRLSSATGEVIWRQEIKRPIDRKVSSPTSGWCSRWTPTAASGAGRRTARQVFSGQVSEPFTALGLDANTVYLGRGVTLEGYGAQRSELLWDRRLDARIVNLCTIGQGAVVATELATYGIAPATGEISWTAAAAERLECSADGALLIDRAVAHVRRRGRPGWPSP